MMPEVKLVVGREELDAIIENAKSTGLLVCIDFWAPWCGPCRMMSPIFDDFSDKFAGTYVFVKVDVDKSEPVAQAYSVMAMPTFVVVRNGEKLDTLVGASKEKLEAMLNRHTAAS